MNIITKNKIKLLITSDAVTIYIEKLSEPLIVAKWDLVGITFLPTSAIDMATAIRMYYTEPAELLKLYGVNDYSIVKAFDA